MSRFVPLSIPNFKGNERKYVLDAVEQGWVSTGGAYISKLEEELASFLNIQKIAACQSGTSALHMSLIDCGVLPNDLVIVPTLTFIAAVNPVRYQFADPIFMDCDDSLCMDPAKLAAFCDKECIFDGEKLLYKENKRQIKAIIVVHVFGNMADMEAILNIAERYKLAVIEDATEALGTRYTEGKYRGRFAGTIGDYGTYSFNGNKIITTGGGGAVTAKQPERTEHLRYLSTQAKDDPHYYVHNEVGYNYRMTNLQAALGVAQMEELHGFIDRKHKNLEIYKREFNGFEYGRLLDFREGTISNKWFYSLEIDSKKIPCSLHDIIEELLKHGIQTRAIWGLIHEQKPYIGSVAYNIEKAKHYSNCILNIPSSTQLTEDDIRYAALTIKSILGELANECRTIRAVHSE